MSAGSTLWKVFVRSPDAEEDYAATARQHGFIAVGWVKIGDLRRHDSFDAVRKALLRSYPHYTGNKKKLGAAAGSLWAFRNKVDKGDLVVAPDSTGAVVYLGIVTGPLSFVSRPNDVCPFRIRRSVRWCGALTPEELRELAGGIGRVGGIQTVSEVHEGAREIGAHIRSLLKGGKKRGRVVGKARGLPQVPDSEWGRLAELRAIEWLERVKKKRAKDVAHKCLGWDLEAGRDKYEVKGRRSTKTRIKLSSNEFRAAKKHGEQYVLLVFTAKDEAALEDALPVEVADPSNSLPWRERQVVEYVTDL